MTQFQENAQKDGRMEGWMEGQTDPISLDPSGHHGESKKT